MDVRGVTRNGRTFYASGMKRVATLHDGWARIDCRALDGAFERLREEMGSIEEEGMARVVVLRGFDAWPADSLVDAEELRWLQRYPLPTIGALEGEVAPAGCELALACDIRVGEAAMSMRARVTSKRLLSLLGQDGAVDVLRLRGKVDAATALHLGLVTEVAEGPGALERAAGRLAEVIASRGPIATRLGKEAIWRGLAMPVEQALRFETDLTLLLQTTKDRAEGVRAFLEKRPPRFTGD